jgi:hypothetical protein
MFTIQVKRSFVAAFGASLISANAADWQTVPSSSTQVDVKSTETRKDGARRVWQKYKLDPAIVAKLGDVPHVVGT